MKNRSQILEIVTLREFDVLVIGGGIVGAGVAQDAASRGLSVLLVERDDFSSGTSSRTTKLIHGGLRYLEQLQLPLTKALCRERAVLEALAPHLIKDFSFILPLTKSDRLFGLKAQIGLTLYDLLSSSVSGIHKHERLAQKELLEAAPALSPQFVSGGLRFHDCITDDARLVLEVIKSACNEGAHAINYLEVVGFTQESGLIKGVQCRDRCRGEEISIRCKIVVDAAGIWTDELLQKSDPDWQPKVVPAKGTHIMVRPSAFETNSALFLPTEDGRYVFVVPWLRGLMIGPTDDFYQGDLNNPLPTKSEVDYLLQAVNRYSGEKKLSANDVVAAWSGIRPLINESPPLAKGNNGQGASRKTTNLSRQHRIIEAPHGMIAIVGGKLTNYRLMANEAVDKIIDRLPPMPEVKQKCTSRTKRIMLGGWTDKNDFLTVTAQIAAKARKLSIEPATLDHLISSYGKDAGVVVDLVEKQPLLNERICPDFPAIMAEVPFCVLTEMAVSLEDLLFRRMRLGMLHQIQCKAAAPKVASLMQGLLNWDDSRAALELAALEQTLDAHMQCFRQVESPVS